MIKDMTRLCAISAVLATGCATEPTPTNDSVALSSLSKRTQARFAGADRDGDGVLTATEVGHHFARQARARFAKLDANHDGKLQRDELSSTQREWLATADRDGNDAISLDAYLNAHDAHWLDALHQADRNGDGMLTPDELGPVRWLRLQSADTDHDGAVSFDELRHNFGKR